MKVLFTGAGGFVGSHCLEYFLDKTNWKFVVLDSFRHKGSYSRLNDISNYDAKRITVYNHDLAVPIDEQLENRIMERNIGGKEVPVDIILNIASDSAVERSITNPTACWRNNCDLILNMLELARRIKPKYFVQLGCYDNKTRALTIDGFKNFQEIKVGDKVLTVNPKNGNIEYKKVKKKIVKNYNGELIHFKNSRTNIMVTPDHRMYFRKEKNGPIFVKSAQELAKTTVLNYLVTGNWSGKKHDVIHINDVGNVNVKSLFYVCGMFIGDGFLAYQKKIIKNKSGYRKSDYVKICRDKSTGKFAKAAKIGNVKTIESETWRIYFDVPEQDKGRKRLEKELKNIGIKFTCPKNKSGEHIYFSSKAWFNFFKQFGKYAQNKNIPKWMLEFDVANLKSLYDGLIDSDGCYTKPYSYTTTSKKLVKDICELGLKIGCYPNYKYRCKKSNLDTREIESCGFDVYFPETKINLSIDKRYAKTKEYNGNVWCLVIEDNQNLFIEREGRLALSGNSDEEFGEAQPDKAHHEWDSIVPSNPYSASKAAQTALAISYFRSFDVPVVLTNAMNMIGEMQDKEKFLPKLIWKIATSQVMEIYGDVVKDEYGNMQKKIGTRFYIHAKNIADAIIFLVNLKEPARYKEGALRPDRYNVVGDIELNNLEVAEIVARIMGKKLNYTLVPSDVARKGYDRRYALDGSKMAHLGWKHPIPTMQAIEQIVKWTLEHPWWLV